jgi:hypothetical protein
LFYCPNNIASNPIILESLVSILIELKRTTKILKLVIKSKLAVTKELKIALGYSVFSDVTLPSRSFKTFLILEGSDENHFEFKKNL